MSDYLDQRTFLEEMANGKELLIRMGRWTRGGQTRGEVDNGKAGRWMMRGEEEEKGGAGGVVVAGV